MPKRTLTIFTLLLASLAVPRRGAAADPQRTLAAIDSAVMPTVYVEDRAGREVAGRLVRATDDELVVSNARGELAIPAAEVRRVWRRGDSVKNGFWIGAGVGVILGTVTVAFADNVHRGDRVAGVIVASGTYGLLGAGIDALHVGRTLVYAAPDSGSARRLSVQPVVSPTRAGVSLALTF